RLAGNGRARLWAGFARVRAVGVLPAGAGATARGRGSRAAVALLAAVISAGLAGGCRSPAARPGAPATRLSAAPSPSSAQGSPSGPPSPVNVYAHIGAGMMNPRWAGDPYRIYVPNSLSDTVTEINPRTYKIIRTFGVGGQPNHITPSWD